MLSIIYIVKGTIYHITHNPWENYYKNIAIEARPKRVLAGVEIPKFGVITERVIIELL